MESSNAQAKAIAQGNANATATLRCISFVTPLSGFGQVVLMTVATIG